MRDVVYVAITAGFFSLAGLLVAGCARIVGPDDPGAADGQADDAEAAVRPNGVTA